MSIMHCANDNGNLAKYYTFSLLDTFQSKNVSLVENKSHWYLRHFYLIDLAEKVLVAVVNMLNYSISI